MKDLSTSLKHKLTPEVIIKNLSKIDNAYVNLKNHSSDTNSNIISYYCLRNFCAEQITKFLNDINSKISIQNNISSDEMDLINILYDYNTFINNRMFPNVLRIANYACYLLVNNDFTHTPTFNYNYFCGLIAASNFVDYMY